MCWPGDPAAATDVLRPLQAALPALTDTVGPMDYLAIQAMSGRLPFGLRHYWKGHFLKALDEPLIDGVVEAMAARPDGLSVILLEAIRGVARTEPPDGTAFAQRGAAWNGSALAIWDDPAGDDPHIAWARETADRIGVGSWSGAGYANYAPVDETNERVRLAFGDGTLRAARPDQGPLRPGQPVPVQREHRPGAETGAGLTADRILRRVLGPHVARLERSPGSRDQLLDSELGVAEQPLAACLEGDAAFIQRDRDLERLTAGLELGDRALELRERLVEGQGVDRRVSRRRHRAPLRSVRSAG